MLNNQKNKNPFLNTILVVLIITILILIGVIIYISQQYSTNQDLRDVVEQKEINKNPQAVERTYEEKVRDGDIILRDE